MKKTIFVAHAVFSINNIEFSRIFHIASDQIPSEKLVIRLIKESDSYWEVDTQGSSDTMIQYSHKDNNITLTVVQIVPLSIDRDIFIQYANQIGCDYILLDAYRVFMVEWPDKNKILLRGNGYTLMAYGDAFPELMDILGIPMNFMFNQLTNNQICLPLQSLPVCDEQSNPHETALSLYPYIESDHISFKAIEHEGKVIAVVMYEGSLYLPVE